MCVCMLWENYGKGLMGRLPQRWHKSGKMRQGIKLLSGAHCRQEGTTQEGGDGSLRGAVVMPCGLGWLKLWVPVGNRPVPGGEGALTLTFE